MIRGVHPISKQEDRDFGGRQFVLSVYDRCEMDPQGVLCVRVPEGDPDYAPSILEKPDLPPATYLTWTALKIV